IKSTGLTTSESKSVQGVEGALFTLTVSPKWEITKFEGEADLLKKLTGGDPASDLLKPFLPLELLKTPAEQAFGFLRDKAVKKDDTWEKPKITYPLGPLGSLSATNKYTYKGKEKIDVLGRPDWAASMVGLGAGQGPLLATTAAAGKKIDFKEADKITVEMKTTYIPPPGEGGLLQIKPDLPKAEEGEQTIYFDSTAGKLITAETRMTIKGTITYEKTEMELKQDRSVTVRYFEKKPS